MELFSTSHHFWCPQEHYSSTYAHDKFKILMGCENWEKKTFILFCGEIGSMYESRGLFLLILANNIFLNFSPFYT